ncbi:RcnB family protein [Sphingomonas sp. SORGH_AS_0879]|uniref:RcnB family protein n=1 Tax=Sphingomonas sp. SORGH_AS_0879 TaxID=3041790 RepID=UPI0027830434|nr:RcnB family protein [Sphingomonas sp. SORGH_AS_0879]MDQ1230179.1 Ni/Co efflux regulator RcnB [Sphingomonas sp. SORGH_AS_0879]
MRRTSHLIAASTTMSIALMLSPPAAGQAGARYPRPDIGASPIPSTRPVVTTSTVGTHPPRAARWGSRIGGRWWGGANAPGGWSAYRRPVRGMVVPAYWNDRRFVVEDWASYPLPQPPVGYRWSRYYDDAILIDSRGAVYDSVPGVDWDGSGAPAYAGAGYPPPRPPARRDDGLGGAAIGAVAGGVAGHVIAGQGNRLGGTLIGAGVGAAAGYAIDRAEDRRRAMPPGHDDYGAPDYAYRDDDAPPPPPPAMGRRIVTRDGTTVTTTTTVGTLASGEPGYFDGGYYYPAPTTTTVVVQGAPVTTTTTTTTTETVRSAPRRMRARGRVVRR